MSESTITSLARERAAEPTTDRRVPHVVIVAIAEDPDAPSSRHLLDDIDEVHIGRGARDAVRRRGEKDVRILELTAPDPRLSTNHCRLIRGPTGWVLDDRASKNGTTVDGTATRSAIVGDGTLLELGHTFVLFKDVAVEEGAQQDTLENEIAAPISTLATFDGLLATRFAGLVRIAKAPVSVMLLGETGTGKEVVAGALHALSDRPGKLVAVNCGALPPTLVESELFGHRRGAFTGAVADRAGLIRSADRGTLFLDEVGELPAPAQTVLLRALQEREVVPVGSERSIAVDVRLVSATVRNLAALVDGGTFRRDLYARLFGLTLELPPLRERRVDLGILIRALLSKSPPGSIRIAASALRTLIRHEWPFNIRELEKTLLTAAALAPGGLITHDELVPSMIPHYTEPVRSKNPAVEPNPAAPIVAEDDALRARLVVLLTLYRGNVVAVSRLLGARRTQVYRWLDKFGLEAQHYRR